MDRKCSTPLVFVLTFFCTACSTTSLPTGPFALRDRVYEQFSFVQNIQGHEENEPQGTEQAYQTELARFGWFSKTFPEYQESLKRLLESMGDEKVSTVLSDEAMAGFPIVFSLHLTSVATSHQGLARLYYAQGNLGKAEDHAIRARDAMSKRAHSRPFAAKNLVVTYNPLDAIYTRQGRTGRAIIEKFKGAMMADYLGSVGFKEDAILEQEYFKGEQAEHQFYEIAGYINDVNKFRFQSADATRKALMAGAMQGLLQGFAAYQNVMAVQALQNSGGVMTSEVLLAQFNAQIATQVAQNYAAKFNSLETVKSFDGSTVSAMIPSLSQQLIDSRVGANAPTLVKDFTATAAEAGGASYEPGAQQVASAVDALMPYRQSGNLDGAAARVEQFAEVFNAFLTQVQEIKK
jgi:hypothetical protein